jgi:hypothetical protein
MFRSDEFRRAFISSGGSPNSANTYNSYLGRIDRAIGGLDEVIASRGISDVLAWGQSHGGPPFDVRPSDARSALRRYVQFVSLGEDVSEPLVEARSSSTPSTMPDVESSSGLAFKLERQLQEAARRQLDALEVGLVEDDGGVELSVQTGRIDILARGTDGRLVVIELKAGPCPPGTIEQALGYAQSVSEERNEEVRTVIVAAEFSSRIQAAARRIPDLRLVRYEFSLRFADVTFADRGNGQ